MEIYGTLFDWFETGTEGVYWSINKTISGFEESAEYDDLFILEEDDYLEIYDPENLYKNGIHDVIWSGIIIYDQTACKQNKARKQQAVCGLWVHWLQLNFHDHEQWCSFFRLHYPAKIIRNHYAKP